MSARHRRSAARWLAAAAFAALAPTACPPTPPATRFAGPTSSQPLALSANGAFLAVANPDNDSVSFFDVRGDRNRRVAEVPVQDEPNGVAFLPDGSKAYVANTVSGTVSAIRTNLANGVVLKPLVHLPVGTEPYSLALTPNGTKLYVANARSNSVTVIDTATDAVIATIANVGLEPRGLAVSNDGDGDDLDETLYVTQFLAQLIPGKVDGADDAKSGRVTAIATATDTVITTVGLNPLADSGFLAAGDALARIPPGTVFTFPTGAYPNQLNNIAIKGGFAYLPNTGASPNGPVRFDVNTQSLLSVFDRSGAGGVDQTINMHLAVANQSDPAKRFLTVPWALAFEHGTNAGFVVSAASDVVAKVVVDPADGAPTVQLDPSDTTRVLEIPTGKNPRGIVVNAADTRAYVMNQVSRDVTVLDLTSSPEQTIATMVSASLPAPGSLEQRIHVGRELYNSSVGVFDPPEPGQPAIVGRMSQAGWGACSACHPFGLSDNVVWIFADGPRRTIPQHADFDPSGLAMRALNWSAARDEQEDFELNIRAVSGGLGLIVLADGVSQDPNVVNLTPVASGGRNQLSVEDVPAWDALRSFVQFGIRAPISPASDFDPDVISGRALFAAANCQQCHGGAQWTSSRVRFTPPPAAGLIVNGQIVGELRKVGSFDPTFFNEVRANAAPPLGADGFAPPSLLSVFAFPGTLFHNGAAPSLEVVLQNVTHRSAGTGGVDTLTNAADRARVVQFLLSIDEGTTPFP
jgi:YVTN family beta-propeller protein